MLRMHRTFALLMVSAATLAAQARLLEPPPAADRAPLYFFLGQSNMKGILGGHWYLFDGSTDSAGQPVKHLFRQDNVRIWAPRTAGDGTSAWGWETYQAADYEGIAGNANPDDPRNSGPNGINCSGPEAAAGAALASLHGGTVYVIKLAEVSWLGRPGREAKNQYPQWNKGASQLYPKLIQRWRAAVEAADPVELVPVAVFWMQGTTDGATEKQREEYGKNLLRFAKDLRKDLRSPRLPFVVARLHPGYDDGKPDGAELVQPAVDDIRAQQELAVKRDKHMVLVDTDAFTRCVDRDPPDPVHFDERGCIDLGRAMVAALTAKFDVVAQFR